MNLLLLAPLLGPMLAAIAALLFQRNRSLQKATGLAGPLVILSAGVALLVAVERHGIQVTSLGDWPAPFGIVMVADLFSSIMLVLTGIVSLAAVIFSFTTVRAGRRRFGYYPLVNLMLVGVSGALLTGDVFNLFVWFELMLISSFVLMALGGHQRRLEGAVKYVSINLLSSAFFLMGAGLLYSVTGTLNMADLAIKIKEVDNPGVVTAIAMLFLVSFGIKSAAFPLFFWLPASYHTPSVDVTALFSGLLTKVGMYALIRLFTLVFVNDTGFTHTLIMVLAAFTMVVGVLGAVAQYDFRRLLSFHIVSQIGYVLMGLAIFTPAALAGAIMFLAHNILVKTSLFFVGGILLRVTGTESLTKMGGMYRSKPVLALLFAIPALSLAGLPPSSGFVSKLALVRAGFHAEAYVIIGISLVVSLMTMYSMTKIWNAVFWKPAPILQKTDAGRRLPMISTRERVMLYAPAVFLITLSVLMGLVAQPVFELTTRAAESLIDPSVYIEKVLGTRS
ncbi:MAG: Na+/H+ antiporter subunit D [Chloroflexi bacterium]|nr:Na+/H+ antiporter subunit D [Chloroflexota bacterium]